MASTRGNNRIAETGAAKAATYRSEESKWTGNRLGHHLRSGLSSKRAFGFVA
jgi:hypothetical protein